MIEWNSSAPRLDFEVQVGLMRVMVKGVNQQDAIKSARKQLSRDMPRMWDVIHGLADARFEVTCCSEN